MPQYFYAVTLLKTGNNEDAIKEFTRMTWWTPVSPRNPSNLDFLPSFFYWPIAMVKAHYWLGVAYEQQGDREKAMKEYQTFLNIWKAVDFDSPERMDAKDRLSKLTGTASK